MFIFLPTKINYTLHSCLSQHFFEINFSRLFNDQLSCFAQQINTIQTYPRFNNSKNYTIKRQSKSLQKKNRTFPLQNSITNVLYRKMMVKTKLKRLYNLYSQTLFLLFILKYFYYFSIILVFYSKHFTYSLSNEGLILILINNKCNYKSLSVNSISLNSKKLNKNLIIFVISIH